MLGAGNIKATVPYHARGFNKNSICETAVPECACSTEAAVLQFPTELRAQSVVEMRRGEKQRQHFSKFLTILLEYRRCRHASKTVLLDWLCRIFGAFVGWLGQKALKKHCICNTFLLACIDNNLITHYGLIRGRHRISL